ncbi:anhydro-N-acetylmuramic acid kinase [Terrimonas pollutisoli]|uniref:anhydro-N-acetylmuramic acid kinase n=1 Tax=Terrimonas pollutisoli TaxID=3034147 RepID=UPI0023EA9790|nr:anhydro-N-acetylmuramic acid kinase [Terrimonas sp. H1YJ31]
MIYRAIGLMSGSSLDGLDIVFAEIHENGGKWSYEIKAADCYPYASNWIDKLKNAVTLNALDYQLLHTDYGHYLGQQVNRFVEEHQLQYKVAVIGSHGHTTFHLPAKKMTAQLGDGAAIAAATSLPVVSDLRAMDVALGGQGAPIVPIGEKLLLGDYDYFLNIGGIANISFNQESFLAFDICAANRVLNMLAAREGKEYDEGGKMAASGNVDNALLAKLNGLDFYKEAYPKSLANDFGTNIVYPLILDAGSSTADALRTYSEHIAMQVTHAIASVNTLKLQTSGLKLLCTGGGAFNNFLVERLHDHLKQLDIEVMIPDEKLVKYKEALIMALIAVLRWREETNVLATVTGAKRDSVGGAMWMGQEE